MERSACRLPLSEKAPGNGSSGHRTHWGATRLAQASSRSHPVMLAAQPPQSTPGQGLAGSAGPCSPPAMLAPSFCQVTSGRGTPLASQDSTVLALTFTITTPGRGFKAGGSASHRNAATSIPPATCREQDPPPRAAHTVHHEPEVFSGSACGAPRRAGVVTGVHRQRLPDLQGS